MCFYDESDYTPQLVEDEVIEANEPTRCMECRRTIPVGGWVRHVFLQEHESCRHDPDNDRYVGDWTAEEFGVAVESLPEEGCSPGCSHDYGDSFHYDRCRDCDQLLDAIQKHEIAEGCHWADSLPNLERLRDAMHEGDGRAYLAKAEELYPGITARLPENFTTFRGDD